MSQRCRLLILGSLALSFTLMVSGCATKRYGRAQPLSSFEESEYTCRDIQLEIHKVEAFKDQIRDNARIDGRSVLGFLGDFGIGNAMERSEAEESARMRKDDLYRLYTAKGCRGTSS